MQLLRWLSWAGYQLDAGSDQRYQGTSDHLQEVVGMHPPHVTQPKNFAALIPSKQAQLVIAHISFPECGEDEIIIENHVVAVNPIDWKVQSGGFSIDYPVIMGEDVAGKVIEVGAKAKEKFRVGQRVMAHTLGFNKGAAYGGFQLYPVLKTATTAAIPDHMSFAEAAVLPLSISTAAAGLFMNATLGLEFPETDSDSSAASALTKDGPALLVWGGSSSVGSSVIQLASAAGYTVVTTASSSNYEYCKELGAAHVIDYHESSVVSKLVNVLKGKGVVGAYDAIGSDATVRQCASVLEAFGGGKVSSVGAAPNDLPAGVKVSRISAGVLDTQEPRVAKKVWGKYVPWALKTGKLVASPKSWVVGKGLKDVQKGLDRQKAGVSARKVVITDLAQSIK